ncbi:hypothetical protein [Nevskia sp.]|uniref:ATP-grasp domain-containing protein n=1 Tax=Nevskia sp. TaxID=1929292 RepID=UPI0025E45C98|nr:hypothetical protein [Nevskia sp.]
MKHTFYVLHEGFYDGVAQRLELLEAACKSRNVSFVPLDSLKCDYANLPRLGTSDLLYNCARGSQVLESLLLNDEVTTFYIRNPDYTLITSTLTWSLVHEKAGLPAPKTVYALTADRNMLRRYVEYLDGFPIVLKAEGGTRGIGTIKIDSWQGLVSLADHLMTSGQKFVMRQFIDAPYGVRAMVLGHRVVAALKFLFPPDDFRNAALLSDVRYEQTSLSTEHEALCVRAAQLANLEMGGVDLLFDYDGRAYLLEINLPTGFQSFSGVPWRIHDKWLCYLLEKSVCKSFPNRGTS